MVNLTPQQKENVKKYFGDFVSYLESNYYIKDAQDRDFRVSYYQKELPENLDEFSEVDIEYIITNLYASRNFGNKQYLVQKLITKNGIPKLQAEFKYLLDINTPAVSRYTRALNEIKGMGPAYITEILAYIQPKECGLWNRKAREALKILEIDQIDSNKYKITLEEYENFNSILKLIADELKSYNLINVDKSKIDLLFVDLYLFIVLESEFEGPIIEPEDPIESEEFDHDEIRDLTDNIGTMLGFETKTEYKIAHGAKVDVVWSAKIGNLGAVNYVFEVQKSGSRKGLLLNLLKAKSNPTVQKMIVISDEDQLIQIETECDGLPEEFQKNLTFWKVKDVQKVAENLESAMNIIDELNLIINF